MVMMIRSWCALLAVVLAVPCAVAATPSQQSQWVEGRNYFVIQPAQPTSVGPGKIEVVEVFSYACPACNAFSPIMDRLVQSLPANVVVRYVPASFSEPEDWPMFQRAYYTAQVLGLITPQVHDAMFNAVWKTNELAVMVPGGQRLRSPLPSIADAARFYARETGVDPARFASTARSFGVDSRIRQADQYAKDCLVDQTPTIIVNGMYRVTPPSAGGYQQLAEVTKYLVAKLSRG
jgi:protein dithiol oxidoreductase (disulfide-forming)